MLRGYFIPRCCFQWIWKISWIQLICIICEDRAVLRALMSKIAACWDDNCAVVLSQNCAHNCTCHNTKTPSTKGLFTCIHFLVLVLVLLLVLLVLVLLGETAVRHLHPCFKFALCRTRSREKVWILRDEVIAKLQARTFCKPSFAILWSVRHVYVHYARRSYNDWTTASHILCKKTSKKV